MSTPRKNRNCLFDELICCKTQQTKQNFNGQGCQLKLRVPTKNNVYNIKRKMSD